MKTFLLLFCAAVFSAKAEELDEAQGEGPFTAPLEPEDNRYFGYTGSNSYHGYRVIEVVPLWPFQLASLKALKRREDLDVKFWREPTVVGAPVHMMVSPSNLATVSKVVALIGLKYKVQIKDVEQTIQEENLAHPETMYSTFSGYDYGRYHNLPEIYSELNNLASRYGKLASVFTIGTSYQGRPMQAIKISAKRSTKTFFFNCGIHAREWVTPATCMYMINQMLTLYGTDSDVTAMVDKMDWVILPVFNVDGYAYTWTSSRARLWRKTMKRSSSQCLGTDPNRNWDINWGGIGSSSNPCQDTYRGTHPFSETEVKQVADYLSSIRASLVGYADIHSFSQLWMYPWGYTTARPRDYAEMDRVARIAVSALQSVYGTYYRYGSTSVVIYQTSGGSNDWVYKQLGVKYSYALELRDRGRYGFLLPSDQIIPTGRETFAAFKAMAKAMRV